MLSKLSPENIEIELASAQKDLPISLACLKNI